MWGLGELGGVDPVAPLPQAHRAFAGHRNDRTLPLGPLTDSALK